MNSDSTADSHWRKWVQHCWVVSTLLLTVAGLWLTVLAGGGGV